MSSENPTIQLPEKLASHINPKQLIENRRNYPEFSQPISPFERERLNMIEERLRNLPLVHCSRTQEVQNLTPPTRNPELSKNTYPLDRSLGLDEYVFLNWGMGDWAQYGQHLYCYPSELLFQPNTLVTRSDILNIAIGLEDLTYEELETQSKEKIQKNYLSMLLSGKDWFRLISLRVLASLKQGAEIIPINSTTFGEEKVLGGIKTPPFASYHGRQAIEHQFYDQQLYKNGFMFENVYYDLSRPTTPTVNPRPSDEQLNKVKNAWKSG